MREIDESVETTRTVNEWDGLTMEDLEIPALECPSWLKYAVWAILLVGVLGVIGVITIGIVFLT